MKRRAFLQFLGAVPAGLALGAAGLLPKLREADDFYVVHVHPEACGYMYSDELSKELRENILEIGRYESFRFIESPIQGFKASNNAGGVKPTRKKGRHYSYVRGRRVWTS